MRIFSAGAILLLAACSQGESEATAAGQADDLIDCAVGGATGFARDCLVEQARIDGARILTVRHPDGGFRRFELTDDGTGMVTADGAVPARVSVREGGVEVAVGADRYRFPAMIADHDPR